MLHCVYVVASHVAASHVAGVYVAASHVAASHVAGVYVAASHVAAAASFTRGISA